MESPSAAAPALHPSRALDAMGVAGAVLGVVHVALDPSLGAWLEFVLVAGIAATIVYSGYDMRRRDLSVANQWEIVRVTLFGVIAFVTVAAAVLVVFSLEPTPTPERPFLLLLASVLGGAMTAQSGLYAAESREELARTEELTKLLTISQRVLRHDLRNELAIALGHLDNIEHDRGANQDTARLRKHLLELLETGDEARQLVTIWEQDQRTEFDLATVAENAAADVQDRHPAVDVSASVPESCPVTAHLMLPDAVTEAVSNAAEHAGTDVRVTVTGGADSAELRVVDTGPGVPEFERRAIMEGEDALAHSRGLGLWLVYWVVQKSEGALELTDNDPTGTVVRIRLPRAAED